MLNNGGDVALDEDAGKSMIWHTLAHQRQVPHDIRANQLLQTRFADAH